MPRAVASDLPDWLEPYLAAVYGDRLEDEMAALNAPAPLDLRVNPLKADRDDRPPRARRRAYPRRADAVVAARPAPQAPRAARGDSPRSRTGSSRCRTKARSSRRCSPMRGPACGSSISAPAPAARRWRWPPRCKTAASSSPATSPHGGSSAPAQRLRRAGISNVERRPLSSERDPWVKHHAKELRPRLCRRAVPRHRHLAAQPRRQMARDAPRTSPNWSTRQRDILRQRRASRQARRPPRLRDLLAAARGKRGAGRGAFSPPIPISRCTRRRAPGRRRSAATRRAATISAPDPGAPRHRRVLRRDLRAQQPMTTQLSDTKDARDARRTRTHHDRFGNFAPFACPL